MTPIPQKDGSVLLSEWTKLIDFSVKETFQVVRVTKQDTPLLCCLSKNGIALDTADTIKDNVHNASIIPLETASDESSLAHELAR